MIEYGYRKNEWVAMYVDEYGEIRVLPFDTFEQATIFLDCCYCRVGVVTTKLYNTLLENQL